MAPSESRRAQVSRVAREVAEVIAGRVRGGSLATSVAHRSEGRMHVWRFRSGAGKQERFLRLAHTAMTRGNDPATELLEKLDRAEWQTRLFEGPVASLVLSPAGRLKPYVAR